MACTCGIYDDNTNRGDTDEDDHQDAVLLLRHYDDEEIDPPPDGDPDQADPAMSFSLEASDFLQRDQLEESLEAYQQAADCYLQQQQSDDNENTGGSLVASVNAAGCFRNMGAVSRLLCNYGDAVRHLQCAEELYRNCRPRIQEKKALLNNSSEDQDPDVEQICLETLLLETMQSRAVLHLQHQKDKAAAIQCHETCLQMLLECKVRDREPEDEIFGEMMEGVLFTSLTLPKHTDLLMVSLEQLGSLYRTRSRQPSPLLDADHGEQQGNNINKHDAGGDLELFRAALAILRQRHHDDPTNEKVALSLIQTLQRLSEVYEEAGDSNRAVQTLHEAMTDVQLSQTTTTDRDDSTAQQQQQSSAAALTEAMDRLGRAHELREDYETALVCYEKALLARSHHLGDHHIDVAKSLINVARVLELQGNNEGSLDLYKAAHAIYARQITSSEFTCQDDDDAAAILQLIPNLLEQERFKEARAYLTKALTIAEDAHALDKSRIYFDLGQAYMGLKDYVSATICLVEAAKEEGEVTEEQVLAMLQRVEVLQRRVESSNASSIASRSFDRTLSTGTSFANNTSPNGQHHHKIVVVPESGSSSNLFPSTSKEMVQRPPSSSSREQLVVVAVSPSVLAESPTPKSLPWSNVLQEKAQQQQHDDDNISLTDFSLLKKKQTSAGSTLPTLEMQGETDVRGDGFDAFFATPSPEEQRHNYSPKSERSSMLFESDRDGAPPSITLTDLDGRGDVSEKLPSATAAKAPLLIHPRFDDEDSNARKSLASGRGLRRPSPRKDDRSVRSSNSSPRNHITKVFSEKLRRRSRQGFQSLPEESAGNKNKSNNALNHASEIPPHDDDVATEDDSLLNDTPVDDIFVENGDDSDVISEITMRFDDPNSSRDTSQEWWWGVTAEGFGRWFPASYVSQAVQAADAFLSAKSIHSKKKTSKQQAERALEMVSDEESLLDGNSQEETQDFLSNVGIAATRVSRGARFSSTAVPTLQQGAKPARSPHHNSLFSSAAPQHFTGGKDVLSEIAACRETLVKQQKEFGKDHAKVATSLFTLAVLYSRDRDIDASIECATAALRIQKNNGDFVDASRSLHFLADLYLHQKQHKQALAHYSMALKLETSHFGYHNDATAKTLNCIGTVKSMQNAFREAMESHEEALRILKECHGEDLKHPLVTETLCQIGSVYYRERNSHGTSASSPDGYTTFIEGGMLEVIGRAHEDRGSYKMAIAFFQEKLQFLDSKEKSRENLEDAASTLNGLGMLSSRAGLLVEAIDYYEKALSIQLQLGCDEVHLATARVLTGAVQFQLGNWRKALKLLQDAVICLQDELGERHETVAATLYQIGAVQAALCDYDLAMDSLNDALQIQQELLGDDHPATLRTRREIGNLYGIYEVELDTAFEQFNFVLEGQKRLHGERHPNIAETLHSIGCAHAKKGDYAQALLSLEECYYMRVEFLGWDHPLQATTLHVIARIHLKRGRLKKAIHICDVVLGIRRDALTERHIDVARALTTKGSCLVAQGDTDKGMECLSEALSMAQESLGANHPSVAEIHTELGALYLRKCQFDEARSSIQKALDIYCYSNLDDDYEGIQDAKEKLERVERDEMLCV